MKRNRIHYFLKPQRNQWMWVSVISDCNIAERDNHLQVSMEEHIITYETVLQTKKKLRLNLVKPLGPTTNLQELKTKEYVNTWGAGNHQIYIKRTIWFLQKIKFEGEEKRK